jgi:ABC-type bacteriocin/lantibiotic exporter with double-glycine peptidase domain
VSFCFDPQLPPALREVSLCITAGSVVGLVGANGSGKTTLADVVAGLFVPATGTVQVDGMTVDDRCRRSWQSCVAYVPQDIYLLDATIAENIALGIDPKDIDSDRMRAAAQRAQLGDLITALPDGYETRIGERGARVSGGQRQRIGIARALYANSSLLILDEATSSLDGVAEAEIMATVEALRREKTIIVIAHRVSTLRFCDVIHELEAGKVVRSASENDLTRYSRALPTGTQA